MGFPRFATTLQAIAGGLKMRLRSVEDLALAMQWAHRLKAHKEAVEAERKIQTNAVNEAAAGALQVEVDGEAVPIEQLESALHCAIEKYVPDNKAVIFRDGIQTARFPSGEVSWKDQAAEVVVDPDTKAQVIADRLVKRAKVNESIAKVLEDAGLAGKIRVKCELDLATIKRLFKTGVLKKQQLPAGLVVTDPREVVVVKPYAGPERSDIAE